MNSFGRLFRISIYGESHGSEVGILIDGCPSGLPLCESDFKPDLLRRQPGALGTTPRVEKDTLQIKSGVFDGMSTGAPILISITNGNTNSKHYESTLSIPRPGHADFTKKIKYEGHADWRGGGISSGRLTVALVAAGVVAKKTIPHIKIEARILEIGGQTDYQALLQQAINEQDSLGGIIECRVSGLEIGLGEPFFDSVESTISHLMFSIPGIKGIEFGDGFKAAQMRGSEFNDAIIDAHGRTATNHSGGINGGISNGNDILFRVVTRPTASIGLVQNSFNFETNKMEGHQIVGRHDACIALRVPVIVEALTAVALADFNLMRRTQ